MFLLCSTDVSTVSTVFPFSRPKLGMSRLSRPMFRLSRPKSGSFDFLLDLKLLFDRGLSVAKLLILDFQSRNISRAPRPGKRLLLLLLLNDVMESNCRNTTILSSTSKTVRSVYSQVCCPGRSSRLF